MLHFLHFDVFYTWEAPIMEFKKYQHIEKLGSSETNGILKGTVHLSFKIDGTNGCIYLRDGELKFGSRNRELSLDFDNCNFMNETIRNEEYCNALKHYLIKHPEHIIYGEWLVPVNIKRYKKDAWKKFYIFDIYDSDTSSYIDIELYKDELVELGLSYVPDIAVLENPTEEQIAEYLPKTGDYLLDNGQGEGIVIKNYKYRNIYGRQTWAKILSEDFVEKKIKIRSYNAQVKKENLIEYHIISKYLTPEHIQKEKSKLIENKGDWKDSYLFELLNRCFLEFFKDNWEIIFKKFHLPTINFNILKKLSDQKIKETLGY